MYRDYGRIYNVKIEFAEDLTDEEIEEIVNENFDKEDAAKLVGKTLEFVWDVGEDEGSHEIENALFYVLEDEKYGTYSYEYVS